MLMNGKEVNNLIINADVFSKTKFVGKKAKSKGQSFALSEVIDPKTGELIRGRSEVGLGDAEKWVIVAQFKQTDSVYIVEENPQSYSICGGWTSINFLKIIE